MNGSTPKEGRGRLATTRAKSTRGMKRGAIIVSLSFCPLARRNHRTELGPTTGSSPSRDVTGDKLSYLLVLSVYMPRRALLVGPVIAPRHGWLSPMVGPRGIQWEPAARAVGVPDDGRPGTDRRWRVGTLPRRRAPSRIRVAPDRGRD